MKKLHFRRFFRQTTTTRGGSTVGPPPEHHHRRRESPTPAAHMCMADDMSTNPSTHLQIPPLHFYFPFLFPPLTFVYSLHQETLMNPWRLRRPTRPSSHSVTHDQKNPREIHHIFSRPNLQNQHRRTKRPDADTIRPDAQCVCRFCSSIFTTFHHLSHFHPFTKYLPHTPYTTAIHFSPPFHRSTFTTSCHPLRHQELGSLEISWSLQKEMRAQGGLLHTWSHQGAAGHRHLEHFLTSFLLL